MKKVCVRAQTSAHVIAVLHGFVKPIKQNYLSNLKSGLSGMASFYRIFGYIGLIIGFFYLNNNDYLHIYSYILGFLIVPISSLIAGLFLKEGNL